MNAHKELKGDDRKREPIATLRKAIRRLMSIADVYSALIDKRSYKEAMSHEAALGLMAKFVGHLDMDLLRAFRSFVLEKA